MMTDDEVAKENAKIVFIKDAMPCEWLSYSEELYDSAELLWKQRDQGYSVECSGSSRTPYFKDTKFDKELQSLSISRTYCVFR